MKDGCLGKCIDCSKADSRNRLKEKMKSPSWVKKERERQAIKNKRDWKQKTLRYREKYPEKYAALLKSQRMKTKTKGNHKHHWSYNKEHYKDIIELSEEDHLTVHRHIIYDQERMMYRVAVKFGCWSIGTLIDTKEKSLNYYSQLLFKEII